MDRFLLDARHSVRALARQKGLVAFAVAALAMGIGFTTTMFSIVHGGTRNLPFEEAHELVIVARTHPARGVDDLNSYAFDFNQLSGQQRSFEGLAAYASLTMNLSGPGERPERFTGSAITPGAFALVGATPAIGRLLLPDDAQPGAEPVVLLSDHVWRQRYASDPGILGRSVRVNGEPRVVVGVMPPRFGFPINDELWLPLAIEPNAAPEEGLRLRIFGRLRDGVTLERASAEMATIARRLEQAWAQSHEGTSTRVFPFTELETDPTVKRVLWIMVAAVSFVLLIACANVANMLLARAVTRTREVAIRTALGASRARIVVQHLVESAVIAAAGGLIGVWIAYVGVGFFARSATQILDMFWMDFRVDTVVLGFSTALVAAAAVLAGIAPALRVSRTDPAEVLKDENPSAGGLKIGRTSRGLVVAQVALACGLLALATLLIKGAVAMRAVELPFEAREIFTAQLPLTDNIAPTPAERDRVLREITERLGTGPGAAATIVGALPGRGAGSWGFALDGQTYDSYAAMPAAGVVGTTPGLLRVLGASPVRGRDIGWDDSRDALPVALVNESWVRRFSPDRDPIGRRLRLAGRETDMTIVGVTPDLQVQDVEDSRAEGIYVPMPQLDLFPARLMVRAGGNGTAQRVRDAVESVHPDLPISEPMSLYDAIYSDKKVLEAFGSLFLLFGAGAIFLTMTGLYGVVSFSVNRRIREVGIRMALGASAPEVIRMVLRDGSRQLVIGVAIGVAIALGISRVMASAIELIDPLDPIALLAVPGILALTGVAALLVPARRAASIAPTAALRKE